MILLAGPPVAAAAMPVGVDAQDGGEIADRGWGGGLVAWIGDLFDALTPFVAGDEQPPPEDDPPPTGVGASLDPTG
jgi:hypothetical protein